MPSGLFDAEQKDDARGKGLTLTEALFCLCIPLLTWRYRWQLSRLMQRCCLERKAPAIVFTAALCLLAIILRHIFVRPSLCNEKGGNSWMATDVGYIRTHPGTRSSGVSMRTLCDGRVWEPHVARAVEQHLFGRKNTTGGIDEKKTNQFSNRPQASANNNAYKAGTVPPGNVNRLLTI